jgi:alkylation response protein AidB-like acyl-CoA dehydrogenase
VDAAMVKAEVVEIALDASDWAMKVHGAKGYTDSLDIEKRVRDLMGLRLADGTTDVLRGQVARKLLGEDLYAITLGRTPPKQP